MVEPSCGEAAFLIAATDRLQALGSSPSPDQLLGFEIEEKSVAEARAALSAIGGRARIETGDFFDALPTPTADAVIGNPPYVRYQSFSGIQRAKAQRAALAAGVRIDGLASSWAAFAVHACQFLNDSGRLALVLPAELLHVRYAAPVRRYLMKRFAKVSLVTFERLVFPGVTSEIVLLLAEGRGESDFIELLQVQDLDDLRSHRATRRNWTPNDDTGKWTAALVDSEALGYYEELRSRESLVPLSQWGRPYLGAVTGNNRYFRMSAARANELGLTRNDLVDVLPSGSHNTRGFTYSKAAQQELTKQGADTFLFYPRDKPSVAAQEYIALGQEKGVDEAYKCRVRHPWWRVRLPPVSDLFLTYMNHDAPRLITNSAGVHALNAVHGLKIDPAIRTDYELLALATLNSATALGAELVGRSYGGGVLKLEPREADNVPVPSPDLVKGVEEPLRELSASVGRLLRAGDYDKVRVRVDEIIFAEGKSSDEQLALNQLRNTGNVLRQRRFSRTRPPP